MCNCKPNITEKERFAQQVVVFPPFHEYVKNRQAAGLSGSVCIDPCILEEIQLLWNEGIQTRGCCCGHNILPSFVNVSEEHIQKMIDMGYVQEHWDNERKDTFKLKSA